MATSKTLTPTNVTISIPEFTDQPDQRVNSNCIDKLGDAVNTLNSNKGDYSETSCTVHVYDYETKIGEVSCTCFRIGKICIVPIYFANFNYSISTMLQFRNLPFRTCVGGSMYIATLTNGQGADRTIQQSAIGVYPRPNITGNFTGGVASFMLIGIDAVIN